MIPEQGIYPNIPFDEYQTWNAVSNSILSELAERSPAHARYLQEHPEPATPALLQGQIVHCQALEPDKFADRYVIAPQCDRRSKEGKEQWAVFEAGANGKKIITAEQFEIAQQVTAAIHKQVINRFIQQGEAEVCLVWKDKMSGLACKARVDYVHRQFAVIIDLKTTTDASERAFQRSLWSYRYFQQAAFYVDGWKNLTGDEPSFVFLPIEKEPPYAVAAYEIGQQTIWAGRLEYRKALDRYAECLKTDIWPGYADEVKMLDLSDWAIKECGADKNRDLEAEFERKEKNNE